MVRGESLRQTFTHIRLISETNPASFLRRNLALYNSRQSGLFNEDPWVSRERKKKKRKKKKKQKEKSAMPGLERINRCGRLIEGARRDFLKYYLKKCPTLFHICYDPIGTHRKARAFVGFLFGLGAAVVLYEGIIVDLQFDTYTSAILGAVLVVMLSIGCALSIQVISLVYLGLKIRPIVIKSDRFLNFFSLLFSFPSSGYVTFSCSMSNRQVQTTEMNIPFYERDAFIQLFFASFCSKRCSTKLVFCCSK